MADPISFRPLTDAENRRSFQTGQPRNPALPDKSSITGRRVPAGRVGRKPELSKPYQMTRSFDGPGARRVLDRNVHEVLVADEKHAEIVWREVKRKQGMSEAEIESTWEDLLQFVGNNTAAYGVAVGDSVAFGKVAYDISRGGAGWNGVRAVFTSYQNQKYIIFKGYSGLRKLLPGVRYLKTNPKVVQLGLGSFDVVKSLKSGGIFTAVLLCGFHVMDYLVRDRATLSQLVGNIGIDIAKVAISTGIAIGVTSVASAQGWAIASAALGPVGLAIGVGIGAAVLLDWLDARYKLKERLVAVLGTIWDDFTSFFSRPSELVLIDPKAERRAYFEEEHRRKLAERARRQGRF